MPKNNPHELTLDRNLALETVRVTEAAALACAKFIGKGAKDEADDAAVEAMRRALNTLTIQGTVVIGEGERDKAPMLYIGEKVGDGTGPEVDIALDPLEGTNICATAGPNSLAVVAIANKGGFLNAPDVYMQKIAIGGGYKQGLIDIDKPIADNLKALAKAKKCEVSELMVCVLNRPRHVQLINDIRSAGASIQLIDDGDVAGVIATSLPESQVDMYIGTGGAPEGVLAAAALRCIGGQMQARLIFESVGEIIPEEQKQRAQRMGIKDFDKKYDLMDLASGDVMFAATGVTDGHLLKGVKRLNDKTYTHSVVMRSKTGTVRYVEAEHNAARKTFG